MDLVSFSCFFNAFKSSVINSTGGATAWWADSTGAGALTTGGAILMVACGAGGAMFNPDAATLAGGRGAGGRGGAVSIPPAHLLSTRVAATTRQIRAVDISVSLPNQHASIPD